MSMQVIEAMRRAIQSGAFDEFTATGALETDQGEEQIIETYEDIVIPDYLTDRIQAFVDEYYPDMNSVFQIASADGLSLAEVQSFVETIGSDLDVQLNIEQMDRSIGVLLNQGLHVNGSAIAGMHDILTRIEAENGLGVGLILEQFSLPSQSSEIQDENGVEGILYHGIIGR